MNEDSYSELLATLAFVVLMKWRKLNKPVWALLLLRYFIRQKLELRDKQ